MLARSSSFTEKSLWLAGITLLHGMVLVLLAAGWLASPGLLIPPSPPAITGTLVGSVPFASKTKASVAVETGVLKKPPLSPAERPSPARKSISRPEQPAASEPAVAPSSAPAEAARQQSGTSSSDSKSVSGSDGPDSLSMPRSDAAHLNNPKPPYPSLSRRMGEEGVVQLSVYILADGRVEEIRVRHSSGFPRLDRSAMEAVRHWRYIPAKRGEVPVPYWYLQKIVFSLKG